MQSLDSGEIPQSFSYATARRTMEKGKKSDLCRWRVQRQNCLQTFQSYKFLLGFAGGALSVVMVRCPRRAVSTRRG